MPLSTSIRDKQLPIAGELNPQQIALVIRGLQAQVARLTERVEHLEGAAAPDGTEDEHGESS